jgi:hypothetical protein
MKATTNELYQGVSKMENKAQNDQSDFRLNVDDLNPDTMNHILSKLYPDARVATVDVESRAACGDGVASTADRITLDVSYSANDTELPQRMILKTLLLHKWLRLGLPAILSLSSVVSLLEHIPLIGSMASRLLFSFVGVFQKYFPQAPDAMYEIESRFYSEIRPELDIEAPTIYGAAYDDTTRHFAILMEDLNLRKAHFPSAIESQSITTVKSTLAVMAALHARYWNSPELDNELNWIPTRFEGGMYPVFNGIGFDLIRYQVEHNQFKQELIAPIGQTIKGLWDGMWKSQQLLEYGPKTLLHGDTHVGNTYVLPAGSGGLLDFQLLVKGNWCIDIAYYIITSLDTETRREHENNLITYYLEQLEFHGVNAPDFEEAFHDYRLASIWGLVIGWLITPPVNYGVEITSANIERTAKAVVDLNAFAAIDEQAVRKKN